MPAAVQTRAPFPAANAPRRPWLTERRIAVYALALAALYFIVLGTSAYRGLWFVDEAGRGIATDFIEFWAAGHLALAGNAVAAYDPAQLKAVEALGLGQDFAGLHPWLYPPIFFLIVAPFALAPFLPALCLWLGATLTAYLLAARAILPKPAAVLAALALPAVCFNLVAGQNGLLTAAFLAAGLGFLESQPVAAGVFIGLLAVKPQLGPLIPLALIASGRWRAIFAAAATVAAMIVLSLAFFGRESWLAFLASQGDAAQTTLVGGGLGFFKLQSAFGLLRVAGLDAAAAAWGHGICAAAATLAVLWLWRGPAPYALKAAALAVAVLAVTPYVLIYDLTLLGVAIAFLAQDGITRGFLPGEKPTLVAIALAPLLYLVAAEPLGPFLYVALAALIARRVAAAPVTSGCAGTP